jgi:hypothetical protein
MKIEELFPKALDEIFVVPQHQTLEALQEGKWITGRFDNNIRIDQPTHLHGDGQTHAHVLGRKGNELGVVNLDGTGSHGSKLKLHDKDADALRARGFEVPLSNLVEWLVIGTMPTVILG